MNVFDLAIMNFFNQFSQKSWVFDTAVAFVNGNCLLRGGVVVSILWWAWFKSDEGYSQDRKYIVATLISTFVALGLAKFLAVTLPFRFRPLNLESLGFLLPYGVERTAFEGWSAFPSDTTALYFSLSIGLLFVSRIAGIFALIYTTVVVLFPRVYLGLHFPTDIVGGAILGALVVVLGNTYLPRNARLQSTIKWLLAKPHLFYPLAFLLTFQIVDRFESIRNIGSVLLKIARSLVRGIVA